MARALSARWKKRLPYLPLLLQVALDLLDCMAQVVEQPAQQSGPVGSLFLVLDHTQNEKLFKPFNK